MIRRSIPLFTSMRSWCLKISDSGFPASYWSASCIVDTTAWNSRPQNSGTYLIRGSTRSLIKSTWSMLWNKWPTSLSIWLWSIWRRILMATRWKMARWKRRLSSNRGNLASRAGRTRNPNKTHVQCWVRRWMRRGRRKCQRLNTWNMRRRNSKKTWRKWMIWCRNRWRSRSWCLCSASSSSVLIWFGRCLCVI